MEFSTIDNSRNNEPPHTRRRKKDNNSLSESLDILPLHLDTSDDGKGDGEDIEPINDNQDDEDTMCFHFVNNTFVHISFVFSCILSVFLVPFSEGFLLTSRALWGVMFAINTVFLFGLFCKWIKNLSTNRDIANKHAFTLMNFTLDLLSAFPFDLIVFSYYFQPGSEPIKPTFQTHWPLTLCRINIMLRIRYVRKYLNIWEDRLIIGEFSMFFLKTFLASTFLLHSFGCVWHRLACTPFTTKHFSMSPVEATNDACEEKSWVGILAKANDSRSILLDHPDWNVLITHYSVSLYWAVNLCLRLGYGDIVAYMGSDIEIMFVAFTEIAAWIFVLANVSGTLTSLLIESDRERNVFWRRRLAVKTYLSFGPFEFSIFHKLIRFYDHLWGRYKGVNRLDLIDVLPRPLRKEVYYEINKFVINKTKLFHDLDQNFLMALSVHFKPSFWFANEVLFRKNDTSLGMYYLVRGRLEVVNNNEETETTCIRTGSVIGEKNLMHPFPCTATARCITECDIIMLTRDDFQSTLTLFPTSVGLLTMRLQEHYEEFKLSIKTDSSTESRIKNADMMTMTRHLSSTPHASPNPSNTKGVNITINQEEREQAQNTEMASTIKRYWYKRFLSFSKFNEDNVPMTILPIGALVRYRRRPFWWRLLVALSTATVIWFNLYQIGFRSDDDLYLDYVTHIGDVLFTTDMVIVMFQDVVTPHKTLESFKEILAYRLRKRRTYIWIFAVIPFEYITMIAGISRLQYPYFYFMKLNRCFQWITVFNFYKILFMTGKFSRVNVFIIKLAVRTYFFIHVLAVIHKFIIRDVVEQDPGNKGHTYDFSLYWSVQIFTSCGNGDISYESNAEVVVMSLGLIFGVVNLVYICGKIASILENEESKRLNFNQLYYSVKGFMSLHHFPKTLASRVLTYFTMQWKVHECVLSPEESVLADIPTKLGQEVCLSQAKEFIEQIPVLKQCPEDIQANICMKLKRFFVPPGETIINPHDHSRNVYILIKGYCQELQERQVTNILDAKCYFGLPGFISGTNNEFRVETVTHCELYCLAWNDFVDICTNRTELITNVQNDKTDNQRPIKSMENLRTQGHSVISVERIASKSNDFLFEIPELSNITFHTRRASCFRLALFPFVLLPNGKFFTWWTVLRVFSSFTVASFVMLQACFPFHPTVCICVTLVFDIIAWIDLYIMFHVAYEHQGHVISEPKRIAIHYLKGTFIFDLISCIPFELFVILAVPAIKAFTVSYSYADMYPMIAFLRLNRVLQIYRLFATKKILHKMIFRSLTFITLLEVVPLFFLFINILSCGSFASVCHISGNGSTVECVERAWITNGTFYDYESLSTVKRDPFYIYALSFYWNLISALCVGYGDLDIVSKAENRIIAVLVVFLGVFASSYFGSKLTACMVLEDSQRIEIREKMIAMFKFLNDFHVSKEIKRRVQEVYLSGWDRIKGIYPQDLFSTLHPCLKNVVLMELYESRLRKVVMLKNVDTEGIRFLCSKLTECNIPEGEFIIKCGDRNDDIFIVGNGTVIAYGSNGKILNFLGPGSVIGEISALLGVERTYSALAASDVEIFMLTKEHFMEFLNLYPELQNTVNLACVIHLRETLRDSKDLQLQRIQNEHNLHSSVRGSKSRLETVLDSQTEEGVQNSSTQLLEISSLENVVSEHDLLRVFLPEDFTDMFKGKEARPNWWSFLVTVGRVSRADMGLIHIVQEKHAWGLCNFTVHPSSMIFQWTSFFVLVVAVSCGVTLYSLVFFNELVHEPESMRDLRYCLECVFIVKLLGSFILGYYDEYGTLIDDTILITTRYFQRLGGFFLDFLTTFGAYFLHLIVDTHYPFSRGIQLLRIILAIRIFNETGLDLRMKQSHKTVFNVAISLCLIFHFWACIWYLTACYGMTCSKGSWMDVALQGIKRIGDIGNDDDVSLGSRYLLSLLYVANAITSTGNSEISPVTEIEVIITVCMIFTNLFMSGFLVGQMAQSFASQLASKIRYQHQLTVMNNYFTTVGLPAEKNRYFLKYFKMLWTRRREIPFEVLLRDIPFSLRADLCFEIFEAELRRSILFASLDEIILRQLTMRIKLEMYLEGNFIVHAGEACEAIYFIMKGKVNIVDEDDIVVRELHDAECFGDVQVFIADERFVHSFVTETQTEIAVLLKEDIEKTLDKYPFIFERIREGAQLIKTHRTLHNKFP